MRYIREQHIKIGLHEALLDHLVANRHYDLALELVETEALPYKMKENYHHFLFNSFIVLVWHGKYEQAYEAIENMFSHMAKLKTTVDPTVVVTYILAYILVCSATGRRLTAETK